MLSKRQLYDYRDVDRSELKLIRINHALWAMLRRERRRNGVHLRELRPIEEAIETVMRLKAEYRAELKVRLAAKSKIVREHFASRPERRRRS